MPLSKINSAAIANNAVVAADIADGTITAAKIVSIANTQITGNIISSQITSVGGSQITANTIANSAFQTGAVENYMNAAGLGFGMRNRIINGAMVIDQRNGGSSWSATNGAYGLDRWATNSYDGSNTTGKFTIQQNAGSVTPPTGFNNYLGATSNAATTYGANGVYTIYQWIEGYNTADLGWGAVGASTVTLSFWVRSSLTGTFGGALQNNAGDRSYAFTYTISSANTWTPISVTIPGDTTGTWLKTNGAGIAVRFGLGTGSNYSGTAGSWASANYYSATGATSVVGTNGATFYITGVQLEKGSTATAFEYRHYTTEVELCHRYYYDTGSGVNGGTGGLLGAFIFKGFNNNEAAGRNTFPVTMRTTPTITCFDNSGAVGKLHRFASGDVGTNITFGNVSYNGITAISETGTFTTTEPNIFGGRIKASAEL